jgi:hypothetical protein
MRVCLIIAVAVALSARAWANGGEEFPFHVGEKLTYQIFWGPFVVGRASLEVAGIETVDGHDCYWLVAKAKTSGLAEWMFPVDNLIESWLDVEGLFTRKSRQNRREGKHTKNEETHYDYEGKRVFTRNLTSGKLKTAPLDGPVLDVISSLYYVRSRQLMLDAEQTFTVNASDENYTVIVRPDQRKQLWVRPVGEVTALRLEPQPTLKIVAANKGRMWFWVSDDARKLPLIVASDMKIGSAKLVLCRIDSANHKLDNAPAPEQLASADSGATARVADPH